MSGSIRRRHSKWDHKDSEDLPETFHDRGPLSRHREPLSPSRSLQRHDRRSKERVITWDREGNSSRLSPNLDEWSHQQHRSRSPRNGWGQLHRGSRSRSRSPAHYPRREPPLNDRSRSRSGVSAQICRNFAVGRCRKGDHCQFLHQDDQSRDRKRPLECSPPDDWDTRQRRIGGSRYSPHDNKDYDSRTEKAMSICKEFLKGKCTRGASCRYPHHDIVADAFGKEPIDDVHREMVRDRDREMVRDRDREMVRDRDRDRDREMVRDRDRDLVRDRDREMVRDRDVARDRDVVRDRDMVRDRDIVMVRDNAHRNNDTYSHRNHDREPIDEFDRVPVDTVYRDRDGDRRSKETYRNHDREPNKREETLCKFFASGNCRNGNRCRFIHEVQERFSPARRSQDDRLEVDRKLEGGKVWDGPRWSDAIPVSKIPSVRGWEEDKTEVTEQVTAARSRDDLWSNNRLDMNNTIPPVQVWDEDKTEVPEQVTAARSRDDPWSNNRLNVNNTTTPVRGWEEDKTEVTEQVTAARSRDDTWSNDRFNMNNTWRAIPTNEEFETRDDKSSLQWETDNSILGRDLPASRGAEHISGDMEISPRDNKQHGLTENFSFTDMSITPARQDAAGDDLYEKPYSGGFQEQKSYNDAFREQNFNHKEVKPIGYQGEGRSVIVNNDGSCILPNPTMNAATPQSFLRNEQSVNEQHTSSITPAGQGQTQFSLQPSEGSKIQLSQSPIFLNSSAANGPHLISATSSGHASAIASGLGTVSSEQLVQLSHLSASLAQLLESRQQLPQMSTSITPPCMPPEGRQQLEQFPSTISPPGMPPCVSKVPDSAPSFSHIASSTLQPNQGTEVLKQQYDPMCDSIEPKMIFSGDHMLPAGIEQRSLNSEGIILKSLEPLAASKSDENVDRIIERSSKAPENRPVEDIPAEDGADDGKKSKDKPVEDIPAEDGADDGKKSKDTKAIRPFKFALAEFVKELLKPSWKDGQVNKDAYKMIVKKVVDKIVETQGLQIPQNKEKIDHYLSSSKQKIEKLVQAYVGRYQKN